jgi:hypothetical protein
MGYTITKGDYQSFFWIYNLLYKFKCGSIGATTNIQAWSMLGVTVATASLINKLIFDRIYTVSYEVGKQNLK